MTARTIHPAPEILPRSARSCFCSDCSWRGTEGDLGEPFFFIHDMAQRIAPNEIVPAGECPECGSLAHLEMDGEDRKRLLRQIMAEGLTFAEVVECMGVERDQDQVARAAAALYGSDHLAFDARVLTSPTDSGTWVSCWAWVDSAPSPVVRSKFR